MIRVKRGGGENWGRRVGGKGKRGGSEDIIDRGRSNRLGSIEQGDQDMTIIRLKKVSENDDAGGKDVVDIHVGRGRCGVVESGERRHRVENDGWPGFISSESGETSILREVPVGVLDV